MGTSGVTTPTQQQPTLDSTSQELSQLPTTSGNTLPAGPVAGTTTQPVQVAPGQSTLASCLSVCFNSVIIMVII